MASAYVPQPRQLQQLPLKAVLPPAVYNSATDWAELPHGFNPFPFPFPPDPAHLRPELADRMAKRYCTLQGIHLEQYDLCADLGLDGDEAYARRLERDGEADLPALRAGCDGSAPETGPHSPRALVRRYRAWTRTANHHIEPYVWQTIEQPHAQVSRDEFSQLRLERITVRVHTQAGALLQRAHATNAPARIGRALAFYEDRATASAAYLRQIREKNDRGSAEQTVNHQLQMDIARFVIHRSWEQLKEHTNTKCYP